MISYYQQECITRPIVSSAVWGGIFTAIDAASGSHVNARTAGMYMSTIYAYHVLQCPMEAISGRPSLLHNVLSAGTIGAVGVSMGRVGIPFVDPYTLYRYPSLSPSIVGFAVYGACAGGLAALQGKRL